ncbi:HAD family hydrolase [Enterococcus sp. UD-01]|jgi:beta-phosphoglucomutase|uniref:HAD family hydrolase n=1 Tax=Enterococcus sp. UD-01 TaxID=3373911 RepID=UPI003834C90C
MTQNYAGIIFDMDGILVDSEAFYYQRRKAFLEEYGLSIETIPISLFIGADMRSLWQLIFEANDSPYDEAFLNQEYLKYKEAHPADFKDLIHPDAKRVLQFLKRNGYKIGLASSSTMPAIQDILKAGQLNSYFDVIVSGTQFAKSKPDPEIYQYTVQELGLKPHQCLAVEDSEKGIRSAHDAGITVWALQDDRFGMDQSLADHQLTTLSEICKKLLKQEESA